ncbi:FTR1 family iron permease [Brevibacillus dissolubilis]|uniref:FTR1 family iron permease n=1 Tax=Brevibacillus dissolubilis TaxID=1844116 RepID=UPI0011178796|nr:FTR1 family protein [Brevibacillus dissolubilis]
MDFQAFLITLREAFEALLIIGIIITYLNRVGASQWNKWVWVGSGLAIVASFLVALLFQVVLSGFAAMASQNYMRIGILFVSAGLLTHMAAWMSSQQKDIRGEMQDKLNKILTAGSVANLIIHSFLVTLREGVETVFFFAAISGGDIQAALTSWGAIAGLVLSCVLAYFFFKSSGKFKLKTFFTITKVLILIIAAGLFSQGMGLLQDMDMMGSVYTTSGGEIGELYNIAAIMPEHPVDEEHYIRDTGNHPLINGDVGIFFKAMLGYTHNPSVEEFISYWLYYVAIYFFIRIQEKAIERKKANAAAVSAKTTTA